MCTKKGMKQRQFLISLSLLYKASSTASGIAKKLVEKWCLDSVPHLEELQERMEFLLRVFASDCGLFARQDHSKTA